MRIEQKIIQENSRISNQISSMRFKNPKIPIKYRKPMLQQELFLASCYGIASLTEQLINEHVSSPYTDIEVLIGDIQLIALEAMNSIGKTVNRNKVDSYQIEDFMENGKFLRGSK